MSIGDFSEFSDRPVSGSPTQSTGGLWRAQIGRIWHEKLRQNLEAENPDAVFEVKIEGHIRHRNWTFQLSGRADQVLQTENGILIREVKTTELSLPVHDEILCRKFPEWFIQLEAYRKLFPQPSDPKPKPVAAELVFVGFRTGSSQTVLLEDDSSFFDQQLERIYRFVEKRREHLLRLRHFSHQPPYPSLREGQESVLPDLEQVFKSRKIALFEAPTGFGKTGLAFDFALNQLKSGKITRLLFLTGKSTGQIQAVHQLETMLAGQNTVSFLQVRSKIEHCIHTEFHCFREVCPYLDDLEQRWDHAGLARKFAESGIRIDLESIREAGIGARICPYELTRALLPHLDIWIGDYNYVFSPANRGLFFNQPGFEPSETFLLIDEAHNLPSRVCDAFSSTTSADEALRIVSQLELLGVAPGLLLAWQHWLDLISDLDPCDELLPSVETELLEIAARICERLSTTPPDYARMSPELLESLMDIFPIRQLLENDQLKRLLWVPEKGLLHLSCLDAAPFIAETIRKFSGTILMSGTLAPFDSFRNSIGLSETETGIVEAFAPWRKNSCRVAADLRVDTRYREREKHFHTTTETVASLVENSTLPIAVFFPSYQYAEEIQLQLDAHFPSVRIALQERGADLANQSGFIEENLLLSDSLFLILGSSFAESIDQLGGRIEHAMIVGPALPQVNPLQKARLKLNPDLTREEAFLEVYQIPGMQRINQALGRLVRAPGHRTNILLHCQRFAEKTSLDLLHPDHRPTEFILSSQELNAWLQPEQSPKPKLSS